MPPWLHAANGTCPAVPSRAAPLASSLLSRTSSEARESRFADKINLQENRRPNPQIRQNPLLHPDKLSFISNSLAVLHGRLSQITSFQLTGTEVSEGPLSRTPFCPLKVGLSGGCGRLGRPAECLVSPVLLPEPVRSSWRHQIRQRTPPVGRARRSAEPNRSLARSRQRKPCPAGSVPVAARYRIWCRFHP
jgi:hypothetical protein